jgi:hypothetical protein
VYVDREKGRHEKGNLGFSPFMIRRLKRQIITILIKC